MIIDFFIISYFSYLMLLKIEKFIYLPKVILIMEYLLQILIKKNSSK